jgi:histidinol-phosphate aminotransferase
MTAADFSVYPDDRAATAAAARWFGVDPDWVCLTNGLDDGIHAVTREALRCGGSASALASYGGSASALAGDGGSASALPRYGGQAVIVEPSFDTFTQAAEAVGLDIVRVQPGDDLRTRPDAVLAAISPVTRLVYLNDPQNPTGLAMPEGLVDRVSDVTGPNGVVLADEAYAEFSGRSVLASPAPLPRNVVVGRTFAKAFGLAGLRIGALVAHPETVASIRRRQPIFHVNVCALRALEAALAAPEYVAQVVAQVAESRARIRAWCDARGIASWPSEANFVLMRVGDDASAIAAEMARRGVLVRDRSASPGCAGCLRLTASRPQDTDAALAMLEETLASRGR